MAITSKLKRHKIMERVIRSLMGANVPPRFKFKDTYASIEVPTAYQQHLPTQQEIEDKFDELETQEEAVEATEAEATVISKTDSVITSNLEVGTSNLFVDTETGRVGVGTDSPKEILDVRGAIVAPVVSWSSSQDAPYLIAATTNYDGTSTNWGTYGFHHRIKTDSGGLPRVTIDTPQSGEMFCITNNGKVGIGTTNPQEKLHVYTDSASSATQLFIRNANASNRTGLSLINSHNSYFNIQHMSGSSNAAIIENFSQTNGGMAFYAKGDGEYTFRTTDSNSLRMVINNSGNVGIGVNNPTSKLHVSGGVSYFPDGISTPGYHAQWTLSGGGNVSWDGSNLLWSFRIIALPVEKTEFSTGGYIDIYCPTSGTITHYKSDGTTGTATCTSSGVPISSWQALWYVVTPGQSSASNQTKFVLTDFQNTSWRPDSNWLLIAVKNGDSHSQSHLKFMPTNSVLRTWIAPSFTNSWVNYNAEYNQCGYYKDSENRVHLRGLVKNGTVGNAYAIFVLPAGYRPERRHLFCVMTNSNAVGRIDITDDGWVRAYSVNNGWVSLDNISFTAV